MATATIIRFDIIDIQTGKVIATAKTRDGANKVCDRKDQSYGAVRFMAKAIWSDQVSSYNGYDLEYRKQFVAEVRKETLPNGQISRQTFEKFEAVAKADRKAGKIEPNEYAVVWGFLSQTMQGCGMNGNPGLNPEYRGQF